MLQVGPRVGAQNLGRGLVVEGDFAGVGRELRVRGGPGPGARATWAPGRARRGPRAELGAMPPPSATIVFKKVEPGEVFPEPTKDEGAGAFDILTRRYGSGVLAPGFCGLGY